MLEGKVVWIWNWRRCDGGDAAKVAQRLRDNGCRGVMVKAWEGGSWFGQGPSWKDIRDGLKAACPELAVGAWGYDYPADPAGDAARAVECVTYGGADFLMLDVEAEFEGNRSAALTLCKAIKAQLPEIPLYYSTFAVPRYHQGFPYQEFAQFCDGAAPQVYASYWIPPTGNLFDDYQATLTAMYHDYGALGVTPGLIYPVIDLWRERSHPAPTAEQAADFAAYASERGSPGISAWSYEHMQAGQLWPRWAEISWPAEAPPEEEGLTVSQYTELKGTIEAVGGRVGVLEGDVAKLKKRRPGPAPAPAPPQTHTVVHGDTLSGIALTHYGDAGRWREIYDANRNTIGPNPDVIRVGQVLTIP